MRPERLQRLAEDVEDKTHVTLYRRAHAFRNGRMDADALVSRLAAVDAVLWAYNLASWRSRR